MSAQDPNRAAFDKTAQIFQELCQESCRRLDPTIPAGMDAKMALVERISRIFAERFGPERAQEFALHVVGFPSDVAFVTALFLFPERFTDEEVAAGIRCFGIEASHHAVEVARLLDYIDESKSR
jgi:hypothetical protein